jgi:hypothetical protein
MSVISARGPYLECIIFKYIPDLTVLFTQFKTGDIDYIGIQGITADHFSEAQSLPDRIVTGVPAPFIETLSLNLGKPQLADKAVRRALYYGLDKKTIIDTIYYGLPKEVESYLPSHSAYFAKDLPKHEYNPGKAKTILVRVKRELGLTVLFISHALAAVAPLRGPDRSHVSRAYRRAGANPRALRASASPIHGSSTVRRAGAESPRSATAHRVEGRHPQRADANRWLCFSPALSICDFSMRQDGADAARHWARPQRCLHPRRPCPRSRPPPRPLRLENLG